MNSLQADQIPKLRAPGQSANKDLHRDCVSASVSYSGSLSTQPGTAAFYPQMPDACFGGAYLIHGVHGVHRHGQ